jgi:hypothetical protein
VARQRPVDKRAQCTIVVVYQRLADLLDLIVQFSRLDRFDPHTPDNRSVQGTSVWMTWLCQPTTTNQTWTLPLARCLAMPRRRDEVCPYRSAPWPFREDTTTTSTLRSIPATTTLARVICGMATVRAWSDGAFFDTFILDTVFHSSKQQRWVSDRAFVNGIRGVVLL